MILMYKMTIKSVRFLIGCAKQLLWGDACSCGRKT